MKRKKIRFYKKLYIGETVKNPMKLIWMIKVRKGLKNIYLITPATGNDLFEIYHAHFLKTTYYKMNPPFIVGIANGYEEALTLVQKIIMDYYKKTGKCDVKQILNS